MASRTLNKGDKSAGRFERIHAKNREKPKPPPKRQTNQEGDSK